MLKYLAKISMDIFPSVLATIIGAYIVNHYINARPAADTPAALVAPAQAGKNGKPADVANLPAPGVKAKGISEKNVTDKAAVEKSAEKSPEAAPQEAARAPESPRAQEAPRVVTAAPSAVRPLPPPINVSTPSVETPANPPYTASVGNDDPNRLTPPADIPVPVIAPPLDLRADAGGSVPRPKTNVADDMLSGVKSMFHAVLPKNVTPD